MGKWVRHVSKGGLTFQAEAVRAMWLVLDKRKDVMIEFSRWTHKYEGQTKYRPYSMGKDGANSFKNTVLTEKEFWKKALEEARNDGSADAQP